MCVLQPLALWPCLFQGALWPLSSLTTSGRLGWEWMWLCRHAYVSPRSMSRNSVLFNYSTILTSETCSHMLQCGQTVNVPEWCYHWCCMVLPYLIDQLFFHCKSNDWTSNITQGCCNNTQHCFITERARFWQIHKLCRGHRGSCLNECFSSIWVIQIGGEGTL